VPGELPEAAWLGPVHEVARGTVLINVPSVGRALVQAGAVTGVELARGTSDADACWLLDGPVAQAARLLRGRFSLRMAGVMIGRRGVGIAGQSACGKSSIAGALALRGHGIVGDNALEIEVGNDGVPRVGSPSPYLELWPDVFEGVFGLAAQEGNVVRTELAKRRFAFSPGGPGPLAMVVVVDPRGDVTDTQVDELEGAERMAAIGEHTVLFSLIEVLGLSSGHFTWVAGIAAATRVIRLTINRHERDSPSCATVVERLME
jgi:hypothetical protein